MTYTPHPGDPYVEDRKPAPFTPYRVEWQGPEATKVVLDEDGVQVRWPNRAGGLEEGDLNNLLDVIAEAKRCRAEGGVPAPQVPVRGSGSQSYMARRAVQVATDALRAEFGPQSEAPF